MEQVIPQDAGQEAGVLKDIESISLNMNGWLKFLGIVNIIMGAFTALSIVGILVAWLPIWLGVLLLQAGSRATTARVTNNPRELVTMVEKLRLYFIIQGILMIVGIAFTVLGFVFFGTFFSHMMQSVQHMSM